MANEATKLHTHMMISMLSNSSPSIALQQNQLLSYFTHKITPFSLQQSLASQALYPKVRIVVLTIYDTIQRQQKVKVRTWQRHMCSLLPNALLCSLLVIIAFEVFIETFSIRHLVAHRH